jgi:hypothetical protein
MKKSPQPPAIVKLVQLIAKMQAFEIHARERDTLMRLLE